MQSTSTTTPAAEKYWQNGLSSRKRSRHLLESGYGVNVEFLVGRNGQKKELIKAHKFVLKMGSSVFEGQFNFNKAAGTPKDEPIKVEDVTPYAFKAMLEFLYLDNTQMLDAANAIDIYFCAKKYMIDILVEKCRQFIGKFAYFTLDTDQILELAQPEIEEILDSELLDADEIFLFDCLHNWAIKQCQIRNGNDQQPTAEEKRQMIGQAIYKIRFPLITLSDFSNKIVPTGLLSDKDGFHLFIHFTKECTAENKSQFPLSFSANEREFAHHLVIKQYYCLHCGQNHNNNYCSNCGYYLFYCKYCKKWRYERHDSAFCCGHTLVMDVEDAMPGSMGIEEARKKVKELQRLALDAESRESQKRVKKIKPLR